MFEAQDIREWRGHDVVDHERHRIGVLEAVSVDTATGQLARSRQSWPTRQEAGSRNHPRSARTANCTRRTRRRFRALRGRLRNGWERRMSPRLPLMLPCRSYAEVVQFGQWPPVVVGCNVCDQFAYGRRAPASVRRSPTASACGLATGPSRPIGRDDRGSGARGLQDWGGRRRALDDGRLRTDLPPCHGIRAH